MPENLEHVFYEMKIMYEEFYAQYSLENYKGELIAALIRRQAINQTARLYTVKDEDLYS